jgi:hypothetical protein
MNFPSFSVLRHAGGSYYKSFIGEYFVILKDELAPVILKAKECKTLFVSYILTQNIILRSIRSLKMAF